MHGAAPWYTRLWRASELGTRTKIAIFGYLFAAVLEFGLAVRSDSTATRLLWVALAAMWTFFGCTLWATLLWRRRTPVPPAG